MLRFWFAFRRALLVLVAGGAASICGQAVAFAVIGYEHAAVIEGATRFAGAAVLVTALVVFLKRFDDLHPSNATVSRANGR